MTTGGRNLTALLLSLMMFMVPAMGVPHEELLQDTLKSMLVSAFALAASFVFFWYQRKQTGTLLFHGLLWLPLSLMAYAFGSMIWSHAYLGGVEAIRWLVFSLILFLGMNTFSLDRVTRLAWGIHIGAVVASLWAALQFWDDFKFFAQGPAPASTFVNRNFFGEFLVCTFPFSVLLITRVRDKSSAFLLTFSLGFNVAALMMTGTRSALLGLLILVILLPVLIVRYRRQCASNGWRLGHGIAVLAVFIGTILSIGSINTANPAVIEIMGHGNAIDRAIKRTLSMTEADEYSQKSFSVRAKMWKATGRMIQDNAMTGVGAGAWEVQIPRYQDAGVQLETDFYAHNEILQLIAEYGVVGWGFLFSLLGYLLWAAYATWSNKTLEGQQEAPVRAFTLASLLIFLLVSNAGFPWRMATTGALFALSLSVLAASDARLGIGAVISGQAFQWTTRASLWALGASAICTGIALFIAQQAVLCESKIVRAVKIAMTISQSGNPNDPGWQNTRNNMLQLVQEGIVINPHYRKLTPIVADSLAAWGDWKNATWIWESVVESRPNVVAILANIVRGHLQTGDYAKAQDYLDQAMALQPSAPSLGSLKVMLLNQTGKTEQAVTLVKELLETGNNDPDLVRAAYFLGMRHRDPELAILALEIRIKTWPNQAVDVWLKLGDIYNAPEAKNVGKALQSYKSAVEAAQAQHRAAILQMIPPDYRVKIQP